MISLMKAVRTRLEADVDLIAFATNGFHLGLAAENTDTPYIVWNRLSSPMPEYYTGQQQVERVAIRFEPWGPDAISVAAAIERIEGIFSISSTLTLDSGTHIQTTKSFDDISLDPMTIVLDTDSQHDIWHGVIDLEFMVQRNPVAEGNVTTTTPGPTTTTSGVTTTTAVPTTTTAGPVAPVYEYAASDADSTTQSTTYQNKVTLTWTPDDTDNWIILGFAEVSQNSMNVSAFTRLTIDGVVEAEVIREMKDTTDISPFFAAKVENLDNTEHIITIDYHAGGSSRTATIGRARILAIKEAAFTLEYDATEPPQAITVAGTDAVTLTFTPASEEDYLLIYHGEITGNTSTDFTINSNVGGVAVDTGVLSLKDSSNAVPFTSVNVATLSAVLQTLTLEAIGSAEVGDEQIRRSRIVALRLDGFFADYESSTDDASETTNSVTFVNKDTHTWTPSGTGDWAILSTSRMRQQATMLFSIEARTALNGGTPSQQLRENIDSDDFMMFATMQVEELTAVLQTFETEFRSENSGQTAEIKLTHFVALPLE